MGKRDVIVRFVIAAAVWLTAAAVLGEEIGGRPGEVVVAIAVLVLIAVAWATFTPNARLFGRVVGLGATAQPMVAITFDDGPSPEWTPGVLDALRDAGARATFFALGRQVRAHPDIARRIVDEGHELASHGDDHSLLVFAGPRAIVHQFRAAEGALADAVDGKASKLFRAPHGFRNPFVSAVAGQQGYRMVGWTGADLRHRPPRRRRDRGPLPKRAAARGDPPPARRRRLRPGRRPVADGRGGAAHPRVGA